MNRRECDAIKPLIPAALDGELDEQEFVQLSAHLAVCPECQKINQDYTRLRSGIRELSRPAPPPHLAKIIRQETVEKPPPPYILQLASRTGIRWGMSTMAASVVGLLVAVLFLAYGIDQRSIPVIANSQPAQDSTQDWPISRPIEIEFSKQMDRDSVEDYLMIWPSSEQDRLPTSWSGNTLIIGRSDDHSVLLLPETDYRITVLEHARDRHGNPIGDFWMLRFRTGPPDVAISTPTPGEESANEPDDRINDDFSGWAFAQGDDDDEDLNTNTEERSYSQSESHSESDDAGEAEEASDDAQPEDEPAQDASQSSGRSSGEAQDNAGDSEPTAVPAEPTAEPEPEPTQPRATATPVPDPTATPRPDPTPEPTSTPAPTQPPEPPGVRGPFGEVYWSNASVERALGTPMQDSFAFLASEQEFQRGFMFRQYHQNRNSIFVFVNGGRVEILNNSFDVDQHNFPVTEKGDGIYQPGGAFGKVWSENSSLQQEIGYSVSSAPTENVDAAIQQFDSGIMLFSRGNVYVIYSDSTWDVFPVRSNSNGGYQGEDPDKESDRPGDADDSNTDADHEAEPTAEPEADSPEAEVEPAASVEPESSDDES